MKTINSSQVPERAIDYRICTQTIMDTSDPYIRFDEAGVCNHVDEYRVQELRHVVSGDAGRELLANKVKTIRERGRGRKYDCILGLSGGVDSTYLCVLAKRQGLRPLVVHFDNGWNSELAVHNIENTVRQLGFDLFTYVVDWSEFRDLQRAYLSANVVDIEVLTDHGFMAVLYRQALRHGIRYVLGGMNVVTEAILPANWIYSKEDVVNIKSIHAAYGEIPTTKLGSYPFLPFYRRRALDRLLGLEVVSPLNWIPYRYESIKSEIKDEVGWRDYGGKHYESVFTRFYQGYILPEKFGFDKRRAHLSTLICSGQISRDEALRVINSPGYDSEQLKLDRPFVLKKLGFNEEEFQRYIEHPRVEHRAYPHRKSIFQTYPWLRSLSQKFRKSA